MLANRVLLVVVAVLVVVVVVVVVVAHALALDRTAWRIPNERVRVRGHERDHYHEREHRGEGTLGAVAKRRPAPCGLR